jgi:hypothetical protein
MLYGCLQLVATAGSNIGQYLKRGTEILYTNTRSNDNQTETSRTDPDSNAFLRIISRLEKDIHQGSQPLQKLKHKHDIARPEAYIYGRSRKGHENAWLPTKTNIGSQQELRR